jgi:hybrid cluster-associated redox disulfide protein
MPKITKNMKLGELIKKYPKAAMMLLDEGIHCVGCGMAFFETVEQGLASHGKTEKEMKEILKKMNEAVKKK